MVVVNGLFALYANDHTWSLVLLVFLGPSLIYHVLSFSAIYLVLELVFQTWSHILPHMNHSSKTSCSLRVYHSATVWGKLCLFSELLCSQRTFSIVWGNRILSVHFHERKVRMSQRDYFCYVGLHLQTNNELWLTKTKYDSMIEKYL